MEITIKLNDKTLEVEDVKVTKPRLNNIYKGFAFSNYARFFDDGCIGWQKDAEANLIFLKTQQEYANNLLKVQGYLFLNDVYAMLGIPKSKSGQVVGWIYSKENSIGDNFIDFGIDGEWNADFINGYNRTAMLDFNVDGNIMDYI